MHTVQLLIPCLLIPELGCLCLAQNIASRFRFLQAELFFLVMAYIGTYLCLVPKALSLTLQFPRFVVYMALCLIYRTVVFLLNSRLRFQGRLKGDQSVVTLSEATNRPVGVKKM